MVLKNLFTGQQWRKDSLKWYWENWSVVCKGMNSIILNTVHKDKLKMD